MMTTRTKRDKFEEMFDGGDDLGYLHVSEVVSLLRRQHNAMVRAVKKLDGKEFANMSDDFQAGQHNAYARVLAALARMKGGR